MKQSNKKLGCKKCNTLRSQPLKNEENETIYWIGAYKDTTDFCVLMSDQSNTIFVASSSKTFPKHNTKHYDYFCTNCFVKLASRKYLVSNKK